MTTAIAWVQFRFCPRWRRPKCPQAVWWRSLDRGFAYFSARFAVPPGRFRLVSRRLDEKRRLSRSCAYTWAQVSAALWLRVVGDHPGCLTLFSVQSEQSVDDRLCRWSRRYSVHHGDFRESSQVGAGVDSFYMPQPDLVFSRYSLTCQRRPSDGARDVYFFRSAPPYEPHSSATILCSWLGSAAAFAAAAILYSRHGGLQSVRAHSM